MNTCWWIVKSTITRLGDGLWLYAGTHFSWSIDESGEFLKIFKVYEKDHAKLNMYNI